MAPCRLLRLAQIPPLLAHADTVPDLDPNGPHGDHLWPVGRDVIVHAQMADAQLPRRQRVRPHGLAIPRLDRGLMEELPPHLCDEGGSVPDGQTGEVLISL